MMRASPFVTIALAALLACSSCAGTSTRQAIAVGPTSSLNAPPGDAELASADFGPSPKAEHEDQIRSAMETLLKDPESARYRFDAPAHAWLPRYHFDARVPGQPHQHGYVFGWTVSFAVNAKNSYGGYTGEQSYEAFFQGGEIRGILQRSRHKDIFGYPAWDLVASN